MKHILCTGLMVLLAVFAFGPLLHAAPFSFEDSVNYWPTWGNGTADDTKDVIGVPNLTGGYGTIEDGLIQGVHIEWTGGGDPLLDPVGDLFIDRGGDAVWDYVVTHQGLIYDFSFPMAKNETESYYALTGRDIDWPGYDVRDQHPVWFQNKDGVDPVGEARISGNMRRPSGTVSFSDFAFTDIEGIDVGYEDFIVAFTPKCANDALYESVSAPVPEPGTVVLLGMGIAVLFGFARPGAPHRLFSTAKRGPRKAAP